MARVRRDDGQTTVELALGLPLLVVLLAAVFEVGMIGLDQLRLWNAAREAARTAVVDPDPAHIQRAAERSGLHPLDIAIDPETLRRTAGSPLTVRLAYRPDGRVPLISNLIDGVTLRADATMRIERP